MQCPPVDACKLAGMIPFQAIQTPLSKYLAYLARTPKMIACQIESEICGSARTRANVPGQEVWLTGLSLLAL